MRIQSYANLLYNRVKKRKIPRKKLKQRHLDMLQSPRSKVWISNDYIGGRR